MIFRIIVVALAIAVTGCAAGGSGWTSRNWQRISGVSGARLPADYQAQIDRYLDAVLIDPESKRWSVTSTPDGGLVCGFVNARNGFGGYTGNEPFYAIFDDGKVNELTIFSNNDLYLLHVSNIGIDDVLYFRARNASLCNFLH